MNKAKASGGNILQIRHLRRFRFLLGSAVVTTFLVWFFFPLLDAKIMTEDELSIVAYHGFGALLAPSAPVAYLYLAAYLISVLLSVAFDRGAYWAFVAVLLYGILISSPMSGLTIESGVSVSIRDLNSILSGAFVVCCLLIGVSVNHKRDQFGAAGENPSNS